MLQNTVPDYKSLRGGPVIGEMWRMAQKHCLFPETEMRAAVTEVIKRKKDHEKLTFIEDDSRWVGREHRRCLVATWYLTRLVWGKKDPHYRGQSVRHILLCIIQETRAFVPESVRNAPVYMAIQ